MIMPNETRIRSGFHGVLKGRFRLYEQEDGGSLRCVIDESNEITDYSQEVIQGLLARNAEEFLIDSIGVGNGGDLEVSPPHNDTGQRVAPDASEEEMRSLVEAIPIQISKRDGDDIEHTALARPDQAIDDGINEFGLLTRSGKIVAHYVTPADPVRAEKKPKTDVYWILKWTLTYVNA
jgi:hypothetical protein